MEIVYVYYPAVKPDGTLKKGINRITYENGIERGRDYLPDGVLGLSLITITTSVHNEDSFEDRRIILCDTTLNNITINLKSAVNNKTLYTIKKTTSDSNKVIITPLIPETIDGGSVAELTSLEESIDFYSDNLNYKIR